jgi:hypothetical protein
MVGARASGPILERHDHAERGSSTRPHWPVSIGAASIYTGFLSAVLGSAIAASTGDAMIGFVLIVGSIVLKMHREEALMTREFPDEYRQFKAEVPALIPFVL